LEQHYLDKYVTLGFVIIKTKYNYATNSPFLMMTNQVTILTKILKKL